MRPANVMCASIHFRTRPHRGRSEVPIRSGLFGDARRDSGRLIPSAGRAALRRLPGAICRQAIERYSVRLTTRASARRARPFVSVTGRREATGLRYRVPSTGTSVMVRSGSGRAFWAGWRAQMPDKGRVSTGGVGRDYRAARLVPHGGSACWSFGSWVFWNCTGNRRVRSRTARVTALLPDLVHGSVSEGRRSGHDGRPTVSTST